MLVRKLWPHRPIVRVFSIFLLIPAGALSNQDDSRSRLDRDGALREVQGIEDPALAAHFLLKASEAVPNRVERIEIIEQAALYAAIATKNDLRYIGTPESMVDSAASAIKRPRIHRAALELGAAAAMSALDHERAAALLGSIYMVAPTDQNCDASFLANMLPDYLELKSVMRRIYPVKGEASLDRRRSLLFRISTSVTSSLQLAGFIELIKEDIIHVGDYDGLIHSLSTALRSIRDGDPEFTAAMIHDELPRRFAELVRQIAQHRMPVGDLLNVYRQYVQINNVRRCDHLLTLERRIMRMPGRDYVATFDSLVKDLSLTNVPAMGKIATKSDSVDRPTETQKLFDSSAADQIRVAIGSFAERRVAERDRNLINNDRQVISQETLQLVKLAVDYATGALMERHQSRKMLVEAAHLFRGLLDSTDDIAILERIAEDYSRTLASFWRPGSTADLSFAYLRELTDRCWIANSDSLATEGRDAVRRGALAGLRGQQFTIRRAVELTIKWDSAACK